MTPLTIENPADRRMPHIFAKTGTGGFVFTFATVPVRKRSCDRPTGRIVGHRPEDYWPQFPGLLGWLRGYQARIADKLGRLGGEVVDGGIVDNPLKARGNGRAFPP